MRGVIFLNGINAMLSKGTIYYVAGLAILLFALSSVSLLENIFGKWDLWIYCLGVPLGAYLIFKGRKAYGLKNKLFFGKED